MGSRQYRKNLYKAVTLDDLRKGPVMVADHLRVDAEFDEIFQRVQPADPSASASNGNFGGTVIVVTTPVTPSTEFAVAHNLGYPPVMAMSVCAVGQKGWAQIPITTSKASDKVYAYLTSSVTKTSTSIWFF